MEETLPFKGGIICDDRDRIICLSEDGKIAEIIHKEGRRVTYTTGEVAIKIWPGKPAHNSRLGAMGR